MLRVFSTSQYVKLSSQLKSAFLASFPPETFSEMFFLFSSPLELFLAIPWGSWFVGRRVVLWKSNLLLIILNSPKCMTEYLRVGTAYISWENPCNTRHHRDFFYVYQKIDKSIARAIRTTFISCHWWFFYCFLDQFTRKCILILVIY